ncbi:MAG: hypothetical protein BWY71_01619 [Planctomycetes bacterium ADurb.Bin412]|nr:MAG: hypothetical protein BWY71_01619 [Planctomycetes bacterium ADurb.Bin412]
MNSLYTIDFLKGEGIPAKSRPGQIVRSSLPFLVLVIGALVLAGSYISNGVMLEQLQAKLASYTEEGEWGEITHFLQENQQQQKALQGILAEVSQSVSYHRQWTGILVGVIEVLPEELLLNRVEVQRQSVREKETDADGKPVDVIWYQYTLKIGTESSQGLEANAVIQEFVQTLRASDFLASVIDEISVVSRQNDNNNHMQYQIDCVFKRARSDSGR